MTGDQAAYRQSHDGVTIGVQTGSERDALVGVVPSRLVVALAPREKSCDPEQVCAQAGGQLPSGNRREQALAPLTPFTEVPAHVPEQVEGARQPWSKFCSLH